MERYLDLVERHAKLIVVLLFAVTGWFTYVLGSLVSDTNPYLLKESHPARKTILDLQSEFTGTYDAVMVAIHNPDGIFNRDSLNALYAMSQASRQVVLADDDDRQQLATLLSKHADATALALGESILADGLAQNDQAALRKLHEHAEGQHWNEHDLQFLRFLAERVNPIQEMASLADMENIVVDAKGELSIRKSLRGFDMDPALVEREIMGNETLVGGVVSKDKTVALLSVEIGTKQDDAIAQVRAYQKFRAIVDDYKRAHPEFKDEVFIAGMPIFIAAQQEIIDHDLAVLFPAVFGIVLLLLLVFFRRPLGVILPLLNILFCTIWTLGAMALLQVPLDLLTSVLPVFLFTICCADAIHVMGEYYEQREAGLSKREANRATQRLMMVPVVLTTATTMVTFMLSTATNIVSIRNFGLFMSVGLAVALLISLLLIPACVSLWGRETLRKGDVSPHDPLISRVLVRFCAHLIRRRRLWLAVVVPVFAAATVLTLRVEIEDSGIAYFAKGNRFRVADEFVNRHVAGTSPGWIAIDSHEPRGVLTPETLAFIDALDQFIRAQPEVGYGYSLASYIRRMNLVLNDMDPAFNRVPGARDRLRVRNVNGTIETVEVDGQALIGQHVMLLENGGGNDLHNVLNSDLSKALTLYTLTTSVASDYTRFLERLDAWLATHKPAHLAITHAGTPVIWTGVLAEITRGQLISFTLASLAVSVMMGAMLKSVRLGVLGLLTLFATSVVLYGSMYLLGIELNIGTTLVTFLVVGVVDYAVHLLSRTRHFIDQGFDVDAAVLEAMRTVGRSTVVNVVIFSCGFLALLLSAYQPLVDLGALVSLALTTSGITTILVVTLAAPWFFKPARVRTPTVASVVTP